MREIKYKAYIKSLNLIVPILYLHLVTEEVEVDLTDGQGHTSLYRFDEVELLQYTGLMDKNGTEIYEHDIIEIKNHPFGEGYNGTAKVYYDEKTMELCAGGFLLFRIRHYAKVIGNIYESELLEVTE